MPITDNMRMRIFAAYIGAPVSIDLDGYEEYQVAANDRLTATMVGLSADQLQLRNDELEFNDYVDFSRCILILRPISSLTDEECYIIVQNEYYQKGRKRPSKSTTIFAHRILKHCFTYRNWRLSCKTIDYLRSINIITTVHGFDLVAEGIAILDSENGAV